MVSDRVNEEDLCMAATAEGKGLARLWLGSGLR